MDVAKCVAKRIKLARIERDLNQEGLAELLGISPKAVSKWERGATNIGIVTLSRIADALNKPLTYFLEPFDEFETDAKKEQARHRRAA